MTLRLPYSRSIASGSRRGVDVGFEEESPAAGGAGTRPCHELETDTFSVIGAGQKLTLRGFDASTFLTLLQMPFHVHVLVQDTHDPNTFGFWHVKHDV